MPYMHDVESLGCSGHGFHLRSGIIAIEEERNYSWLTRLKGRLEDLVCEIIEGG